MVEETLWFSLGTVGMLLGTLVLGAGVRLVPRPRWRRYAILVAVPAIAVIAYAVMAVGVGTVQSSTGAVVFVPRYIDWLLTTPLHVVYLGLFAGASMGTIGRAAGFQAATIVFGFVGTLLPSPFKWVLYLAGSAAFGVVVYYAFTAFVDAATDGGSRTALYRQLRTFMVVLWLVYPVIWAVGPNAIGLMDIETTALLVSYIDIVSKVGFGLIALNGHVLAGAVDSRTAVPGD